MIELVTRDWHGELTKGESKSIALKRFLISGTAAMKTFVIRLIK